MRFTGRLKDLVKGFMQEIEFYGRVLKHPRTPFISKILLGIAIAYALSPVDLIPDFIPVLGYLDDLLILPILIRLAIALIPKNIIIECRGKGEL
ncbi:MAG: DUF1232 domain-containing protein [Deltaproteobacteria bacterium]|nr:DUF1232 domain-containing protein [Deltaproteobacteria bacterium]